MPVVVAIPQENDRYVGDEGQQWIMEDCRNLVEELLECRVNMWALDGLGRCCVTSTIAGLDALFVHLALAVHSTHPEHSSISGHQYHVRGLWFE